MTNAPQFVLLSVMGPHAGESERAIFERKMNDIHTVGVTYWLTRSRGAKPDIIQEICRDALAHQKQISCIFIEPRKRGGAAPTSVCTEASSFSPDTTRWSELPPSLSPVTGKIDSGAFALVFDELKFDTEKIDLWDFRSYADRNKPLEIQQGASTFGCVRAETGDGLIKSRYRSSVAVGRLVSPFCVWLR